MPGISFGETYVSGELDESKTTFDGLIAEIVIY